MKFRINSVNKFLPCHVCSCCGISEGILLIESVWFKELALKVHVSLREYLWQMIRRNKRYMNTLRKLIFAKKIPMSLNTST